MALITLNKSLAIPGQIVEVKLMVNSSGKILPVASFGPRFVDSIRQKKEYVNAAVFKRNKELVVRIALHNGSINRLFRLDELLVEVKLDNKTVKKKIAQIDKLLENFKSIGGDDNETTN
jgi:hypothetical protein